MHIFPIFRLRHVSDQVGEIIGGEIVNRIIRLSYHRIFFLAESAIMP